MAEEQKLASGSGALQNVFGTGDENIRLLEKQMRVRVALRGGDMQRASALYPETAAAYRQACAAIGDLDTDA